MTKQKKWWQTLFSWAPKPLQMVTAAMTLKYACSLEEKLDKPIQHIKQQRQYFANKGSNSQSYDFSSSHVGMWELNHKNTECWRIYAFELWCWRRLLRVPWTARRSNQFILMKISPECSLEGLMLKLKFQYFDHLMRRVDSLEKTLMLGKIEGRRRRGWQRMRLLDDITDLMNMGLGGLRELVMDKKAWRAEIHRVTKSQIQLSDWTELKRKKKISSTKVVEDFKTPLSTMNGSSKQKVSKKTLDPNYILEQMGLTYIENIHPMTAKHTLSHSYTEGSLR